MRPPNLRSLIAQGYYRGGRSTVSRQSRSFCSAPISSNESKGAGETVGAWLILRPVAGLSAGAYISYRLLGSKASEIEKIKNEKMKETEDYMEQSEKKWSDLVASLRKNC